VEGNEWHAQGDVVIREGVPQLARRVEQGSSASAPAGSRPMPSVQDFPLVGQREYWAKGGDRQVDQPPLQQQPEAPRRPSLLQRITGVGRDRRGEGTPAGQQKAVDRPGSERVEEDFDLPVFFGRDRRK
jgi:hypothetical protein